MSRRRMTIKDVAALAGVSVSTVSRVLNKSGPISEDTQRLVLSAAEQLKYQPNPLARGLVKNQLGGVGVLVPWLGGPYFCTFLEGVQQVVRESGFRLVISSEQALPSKELDALAYLLENDADGVIYYGDGLSDEDIASVNPLEKPVVVVGRSSKGLPVIGTDDEGGAFLATRYLLQHGHHRIAHVTGPMDKHVTLSRLTGHQRALQQAGVQPDPALLVHSNFSEVGGHQAIQQLLSRGVDFTAVFTSNDQMAMGAYQALREFNLRVPEDVSVVGFDDIPFSQYLHPALTTVRVPVADMGGHAARTLLSLLQGEQVTPPTLQAELVIRQSVRNLS